MKNKTYYVACLNSETLDQALGFTDLSLEDDDLAITRKELTSFKRYSENQGDDVTSEYKIEIKVTKLRRSRAK